MGDDVAILKQMIIGIDQAGNQTETYQERAVFVKPQSVYANDFYRAAHAGLKPSLVLVLSNAADYEGEQLVEFHGVDFAVIRAYRRPNEDAIELTLEERIGDVK